MNIVDVYWTETRNTLVVKCDCGEEFRWPTNVTLMECFNCDNKEWWYGNGYLGYPIYKTAKMFRC